MPAIGQSTFFFSLQTTDVAFYALNTLALQKKYCHVLGCCLYCSFKMFLCICM